MRLTSMEPFISFESATVKRSYGILTHVTHLGMDGALKGKIVTMVYLVVPITELSDYSLYGSVNDHFDERGVLYRSKIGNDLLKIPHTCYFGLVATAAILAYEHGGLGAVGRDQGRFQ